MTNIPHDEPGYRHRRCAGAAVCLRGTMLKINSMLGFWNASHRAHHLQSPVCHSERSCRSSSRWIRTCVEAALDLGCTPLQAFHQGRHPRDHARHHFRRSHGLHHEPGRFRHQRILFTGSSDLSRCRSRSTTTPKSRIQPKIYALFTLLFVAILVVMVRHESPAGAGCQALA